MSELPKRKSPRASFHDYSGGNYFVTICTHDKKPYFGYISDNMMHLSTLGKYVRTEMEMVTSHFPYAEIPIYIVMPNHLHAIVCIDNGNPEETTDRKRPLLSVVIGGIKQAVTRFAKNNRIDFRWQNRFHDHIIRNSDDARNICRYIESNVDRWMYDCYFY